MISGDITKRNTLSFSPWSISALLFSTAIWGGGFVFVKWLLPFFNTIEIHQFRFFLAGLIGFIGVLYFRKDLNRKQLYLGFIASLFLNGMLIFQTLGLGYTTVAKSGFLTTTYVLFIPVILFLYRRQHFPFSFYIALLLSILGIYFLSGSDLTQLNLGDYLTIICGLFAALHIIYLEFIQKEVKNSFAFNCLQCLYIGLFSLLLYPFVNEAGSWEKLGNLSFLGYAGLIGLGFFSSVLAFTFQVVAQKKIPSHIVGLLFLLESPFAALFGYVSLGEQLTLLSLVGCALILVACAIAILYPSSSQANNQF